MTRKVDFRNYSDAQLLRVCNHFAHLVLSVVASVTDAILLVLRVAVLVAYDGLVAPCTDVGQLWVGLDFGSPALVFGKMPVEAVELEGGHDVEHLFRLLDCPEMPSAVKMHSAIAETRHILDFAARQYPFLVLRCPSGVDCGREHLLKGLKSVEDTGIRGCEHHAFLLVDGDGVSFFLESRVNSEHYSIHLSFLDGLGESHRLGNRINLSGSQSELSRKISNSFKSNVSHGCIAGNRSSFEVERSLVFPHAERLRNHIDGRSQNKCK